VRSARRRTVLVAAAAAAAALAFPALASAHAVLLKTSPVASETLNTPPSKVSLTFSEAVEPRFAVVSVTNAAGEQQTSGPPARSPTNPNELDVPLRQIGEGWYLVYWRVISVDGHPVRGAFTFAVGPNPGPAPQFVIPSLSESAATPRLLIARWATYLSLMAAIGLFVLRMLTARPVLRRVPGTSLDPLTVTFGLALVAALVATPLYVEMSTAEFARRSFFDFGNVVPLVRDSAFGRAYTDLEIILVLFGIASFIAIVIDRPDRPQRSVAELLALDGALAAAAAAVLVPGLAGHAAQTSPRGLALALDWIHVAGGSIWIGGLIGLVVVWITLGSGLRLAGLQVVVPRFSKVALASVLLVLATGVWASILHLPTVASLWQTSYGKALIVKVSILLGALLLGATNNQRTVPRLAVADTAPGPAEGASKTLRSLVSLEVVIVAAVIFAAGVLSSLAPPSKALASISKSSVRVGPGPVTQVVNRQGYRLEFHVSPNRAAVPNAFTVRITKNGAPVRNADVTTTFTMLDMEMGQQGYRLPEVSPGVYAQSKPALVMVGHWGLTFDIAPPTGQPLTVQLVDRANG
jgi:copper transport protein